VTGGSLFLLFKTPVVLRHEKRKKKKGILRRGPAEKFFTKEGAFRGLEPSLLLTGGGGGPVPARKIIREKRRGNLEGTRKIFLLELIRGEGD